MHKLFNIFFISSLSFLMAKEPFLATLVNVNSNDIQTFRYGNTKFICKTYGAISIDEIYRKADEESTCKKSIGNFYKKRKDLLYYSNSKLSIYQSYSLVLKGENRCLINILGEKSLSEFLIEEGLALQKPNFKDKEYSYYFYMSEQKAKVNLRGIWAENITKDCVAYIYTPEELENLK